MVAIVDESKVVERLVVSAPDRSGAVWQRHRAVCQTIQGRGFADVRIDVEARDHSLPTADTIFSIVFTRYPEPDSLEPN
jgi:hypothetical protein